MKRIPLATQTLYAELVEQLIVAEANRSVGSLSGCFTFKKVKGKEYCYFQSSEPGGVPRQIYIGPRNPAFDSFLERYQGERQRVTGNFYSRRYAQFEILHYYRRRLSQY